MTSKDPTVASSVSYVAPEIPEDIFTLLVTEVLLHPPARELSDQLLNRRPTRFHGILQQLIRELCRRLRKETPTLLQRSTIHVLSRYPSYLAFRVSSALKRTTHEQVKAFSGLTQQNSDVAARTEAYLQELSLRFAPLPAERTSVQSIVVEEAIPHRDQDAEISQDQSLAMPLAELFHDSNAEEGASEGEEASSDEEVESVQSDREDLGECPTDLTKQTINWLVESLAYQNFVHDMRRVLFLPMEYVEACLSQVEGFLSISIGLPWDIVDYLRTQLDNVYQASTVLTLTGDIDNAEATSCQSYCDRTWPTDGLSVLESLKNAVVNGYHRERKHPLNKCIVLTYLQCAL